MDCDTLVSSDIIYTPSIMLSVFVNAHVRKDLSGNYTVKS